MSRCRVAGIVTRVQVGRSGVRIPVVARYPALVENMQPDFGAHEASYLNGYQGSFPREKRPRSKVDQFPACS
jgi:hypothetical protein